MQVKSLMLGYENWAIPTDPVIHIGPYTPEVIKTGQYKYRTYGANGNKPHGFGVLVAYAVICGNDLGYTYAKAGEEKFFNRHKIKVDDYWKDVWRMSQPEHMWLTRHAKYDYQTLINERPWTVDDDPKPVKVA